IIASIAVVLYAFSPLFQLSSRWVSNPTFGFILMPFLLFFLFRFLTKQKRIDAFLSAVFLGLLIQANLGNLIFLFLLPIFFVVFKIRIKSLNIPLFLLGLFLNLSTFLIAEIRFSGRGITSIMEFFNKTHSSYVFSLNYPISLATKIYDFLSSSVLPFSESFVFLIIIFVCVFLLTNSKFKKAVRKDYKPLVFLGIWLLNIVIFRLFLTGYSNSWFMFLPSLLALVILSSYFLFYIFKNKYVLFLAVCLIVLGQLLGNYKWLSLSSNIFSSRDKTTYLVEKELIDYTYKASDYKPFSISTITVPLYINTAWDYLYTFYGNKRYKYTPYWDGRDQAGYLGKMTSQKDATEYRYLIIEPQVPEKFIFDETLNEDNTSVLIERKQIGNFIVEKRRSKAKIPQ
ncbi:MAG: hypothetical protein HYT06_02045, partial [Candidatus Levybacteria bacterium]|nr:hypothetical protein [Candidatus Levybacteria bacterium]